MFLKCPFTEMIKAKMKIHSEKLLIFKKSVTVSAGNIDYTIEKRRIWKKGVCIALRMHVCVSVLVYVLLACIYFEFFTMSSDKENVSPNIAPKVIVLDSPRLDYNELLSDAQEKLLTKDLNAIINLNVQSTGFLQVNSNRDSLFQHDPLSEGVIEISPSGNEIISSASETDEVVECDSKKSIKKKRKYTLRRKRRISSKEAITVQIEANLNNHPVLPGCNIRCKKRCATFFNENNRRYINSNYWTMDKQSRRIFIQERTEQTEVKRCTAGADSRRVNTLKYSFQHPGTGEYRLVCKTFFLTTLGLQKNNDTFIQNTFHDKNIRHKLDKRKLRTEKIKKEDIVTLVESYNPTISHYRRVHAPNPSNHSTTNSWKNIQLWNFPTNLFARL